MTTLVPFLLVSDPDRHLMPTDHYRAYVDPWEVAGVFQEPGTYYPSGEYGDRRLNATFSRVVLRNGEVFYVYAHPDWVVETLGCTYIRPRGY